MSKKPARINPDEINSHSIDLTTLNKFNEYVLSSEDLSEETKLDVLRVVNCLKFIRVNNEFIHFAVEHKNDKTLISKRDRRLGVLRDFDGTSFHLNSYHDGEQAVKQLNDLIEQFEQAICQMGKKKLLAAFANKINYDGEVGCLEARIEAAIQFAAEVASTKTLNFDNLMQSCMAHIKEENHITKKIFDYLKPYMGHTCRWQGITYIIDNKLINTYVKDVLCISDSYSSSNFYSTSSSTLYSNRSSNLANGYATFANIMLGKDVGYYGMIRCYFAQKTEADEFVAWLKAQPALQELRIDKARTVDANYNDESVYMVRVTKEQLTKIEGKLNFNDLPKATFFKSSSSSDSKLSESSKDKPKTYVCC